MASGVAAQLSPPGRVLLIKPSALGDVVTALPVLRGLRRTFPQAHLAWMVNIDCAALIESDSQLDEVIEFDRRKLGRAWRSPGAAGALVKLLRELRAGRFDWVIDLQGLIRSGIFGFAARADVRAGFADAREAAHIFYTHAIAVKASHTVDRNIELAKQLGIDARPEDMTLEVTDQARQTAAELLGQAGIGDRDFIACVPPTRWATKLYPVRHWRKVVAALAGRLPVVLLGSPGDRQLCQAVATGLGDGVQDLSGQTNICEMVALIAASSGVVCSDSAAKFIAPAVGREAVVLIGPTREASTGPYLRGRAIVADLPCQGCLKKQCNHVSCMELIEPSAVISAAEEMLDGQEK